MIKPVLVVVLFSRPKYTRMLFAALEKCYGIQNMPMLISIDGGAPEGVECQKIAEEFCAKTGKTNAEIVLHPTNFGIDLHKLWAIPKAFERGDYVIFCEDDTPLSPDALNYFVAMGEKYKDDKDVFSISAYNRVSASEWFSARTRPYVTERCKGFVPWAFSVWKGRWDILFADGAKRYLAETGTQANGLFDHNWCELGHDYIRPVVSRSNHVGGEGATHTPSVAWLHEHEFCRYGAWQLDLPNDINAWDS